AAGVDVVLDPNSGTAEQAPARAAGQGEEPPGRRHIRVRPHPYGHRHHPPLRREVEELAAVLPPTGGDAPFRRNLLPPARTPKGRDEDLGPAGLLRDES